MQLNKEIDFEGFGALTGPGEAELAAFYDSLSKPDSSDHVPSKR